MPELKCKGVILCDEIRQEMSGKYLILGAYPSGITVQSMPANLGLSLYFIVEFSDIGSQTLHIDVTYLDHNAKMIVELEVAIPNTPMAVPTPRMPFSIADPCDLVVSVGLDEDKLSEAARFSVGVNPEIWTMYPIEHLQPSEQ